MFYKQHICEALNFRLTDLLFFPSSVSHPRLAVVKPTCMAKILNYSYFAKGLIVPFKAVQFKVRLKE